MTRKRSWTDKELIAAVAISKSYRAVIILLRLVPAGGNYEQAKAAIKRLELSTTHFTGMGWSIGMKRSGLGKPIGELLVIDGVTQSYTLKRRLFRAGLKTPACEMCGWAQQASDGRIPVELDHINGNRHDNRLENLRVLCPNCHSLQPTHRGKNKKRLLVSAEMGEWRNGIRD